MHHSTNAAHISKNPTLAETIQLSLYRHRSKIATCSASFHYRQTLPALAYTEFAAEAVGPHTLETLPLAPLDTLLQGWCHRRELSLQTRLRRWSVARSLWSSLWYGHVSVGAMLPTISVALSLIASPVHSTHLEQFLLLVTSLHVYANLPCVRTQNELVLESQPDAES